MKTTKIKLKDGWCVNRHTFDMDCDMEWYSVFHHHDGRGFEVNFGPESDDKCFICNKSVPDNVVGFVTLCEWKLRGEQ
jgi:hypothetical protein